MTTLAPEVDFSRTLAPGRLPEGSRLHRLYAVYLEAGKRLHGLRAQLNAFESERASLERQMETCDAQNCDSLEFAKMQARSALLLNSIEKYQKLVTDADYGSNAKYKQFEFEYKKYADLVDKLQSLQRAKADIEASLEPTVRPAARPRMVEGAASEFDEEIARLEVQLRQLIEA